MTTIQQVLSSTRLIDPRALGAIVLPAFVAGYFGSLVILACLVAFLIGLHASQRESGHLMRATNAELANWKTAARSAGIPFATFVKTSCNHMAAQIATRN